MNAQQKVAIVTGAASGIGKSVAECYGEMGVAVVVADLDGGQAERTARILGGRSMLHLSRPRRNCADRC